MPLQFHKAPRSGPHRVRVRMSVLIILALAVLACGAPAAYASVGSFEGGDGDQVSASCAGALDWQCLSQSQVDTTLDPSGESDLVFVSGNKEDNPDGWPEAPQAGSPVGGHGAPICWYWRADAAGVATWGPTSRPVPQWTRPGAAPMETLGRQGDHH